MFSFYIHIDFFLITSACLSLSSLWWGLLSFHLVFLEHIIWRNGDFLLLIESLCLTFQCVFRYEMDMLLGSVSSAIKHVENLLEKMNNNTISVDTTICIEKHLSGKLLV